MAILGNCQNFLTGLERPYWWTEGEDRDNKGRESERTSSSVRFTKGLEGWVPRMGVEWELGLDLCKRLWATF